MNKIFTSLAALAMCVSLGAQETAPRLASTDSSAITTLSTHVT